MSLSTDIKKFIDKNCSPDIPIDISKRIFLEFGASYIEPITKRIIMISRIRRADGIKELKEIMEEIVHEIYSETCCAECTKENRKRE